MKKKLFLLFFLAFIFHLIFRVYSYKSEYTVKYDSKYWKERYLRSQWIPSARCDWDPHINPITCVWDDSWNAAHPDYTPIKKESIGDDGLYAYAGWEYMQGKDPTLLNAEMPPLGKYLIGLSIKLFQNQNIFALFSGILALSGLYLLSSLLIKDKFFAFLPVFLFSLEPLFFTQLRAPFLDLLYLAFLCFTFYFLIRKKLILSLIALGLMMGTKASFNTFGTVVFSVLLYFSLAGKFNLAIKYLLLLPLALLTFTLTYLKFFLLGHTLIDFLKVQKWIVNFYLTGAKGNYGDIFQILLTGRWSTWWDKTISIVSEWRITWPLLFISLLFIVYFLVKKKKIFPLLVIWSIIYLLFLTFVPVFPRYLLVVIPFMYIILANYFFNFIKSD